MRLRDLARRALVLGFACGPHITRYAMYKALENICADEGRGAGKKVLSISWSTALVVNIGLENAEIVEANFPEHNFLDLKAFPNDFFDVVVSDQVLEHVEGSPRVAFNQSLRVLKPGGVAVHTTCFINPIHGAPSDFWRFTPDGLRLLARDFSEIVCLGAWGNRIAWIVIFMGLRFVPVPHARWHPFHIIATRNSPPWPITIWIAVRK
jgi:SAM-dependent methyltransferase